MTAFPRLLAAATLVLPLLLTGCGRGPDADARFVGLANRTLDRMLAMEPEWATSLGDHRFDAATADLSAAGQAARLAFAQAVLDTLATIDPAGLGEANRIDAAILRWVCEGRVFALTELREHTWNPTLYNPGDGIHQLLLRETAPAADRLEAAIARVGGIPQVFAAARENLREPPAIMTEAALEQLPAVVELVTVEMDRALADAPALRAAYAPVRAEALAALAAHERWLREDLLPRSTGDFRLGAELYRRKLMYALDSDLTPAAILAAAEMDLLATRDAMHRLAVPLHAKYGLGDAAPIADKDAVIRAVLDRLAGDRPDPATILDQARRDLAAATDFVRERGLVTVPDDPVEVMVMPPHRRGWSFAYCEAPGPLQGGGRTVYAISPPPDDWTAARTETFYREYNDWMLQVMTCHEAMPGHALQLALANRYASPTPLRAVFASDTFVEGWSTYAERLMADAGFGGPELQLMQLKSRLRMLLNAVIDQKIHGEGMTEAEAAALLRDEGFQEEAEAAAKARRACLSSTQLSTYYVGNLEIVALRERAEELEGARFDARTFHDRLLAHGSPAPRHLRQLLDL